MAATETTMKNIFGDATITNWADPDGSKNGTKIANRIAWAIAMATEHIYEYLRAIHVRVPAESPTTGEVPKTVEYAASLMAGLLLYTAYSMYENIDAGDGSTQKLAWFRDELARILAEWRNGVRVIDARTADV